MKAKLINVEKKADGTFDYTLSEEGRKCQFLQFLINEEPKVRPT